MTDLDGLMCKEPNAWYDQVGVKIKKLTDQAGFESVKPIERFGRGRL